MQYLSVLTQHIILHHMIAYAINLYIIDIQTHMHAYSQTHANTHPYALSCHYTYSLIRTLFISHIVTYKQVHWRTSSAHINTCTPFFTIAHSHFYSPKHIFTGQHTLSIYLSIYLSICTFTDIYIYLCVCVYMHILMLKCQYLHINTLHI